MVIFVLPLLLLVGAVALGLVASHRSNTGAGGRPDNRPLALPPVEAPDAAGPDCTRLLAALPATLTASPAPLPRLALLAPAPAGVAAWAGTAPATTASSASGSVSGSASGDPVVLRCGLPKPPELTNSSALIVIDGVSWLNLSQPDRDTFIAVDRPVYLAVTVPRGLGTGPVQTLSDIVRTALPAR
ncbi:MAG TPA: DUF3515 domain-containing protein [Pseudonocardia sp.]|nr:DUF3515 domain-containing protein [Pseudonocardia sp.]